MQVTFIGETNFPHGYVSMTVFGFCLNVSAQKQTGNLPRLCEQGLTLTSGNVKEFGFA